MIATDHQPQLGLIAAQINRDHQILLGHSRRTFLKMRDIGEQLLQVKGLLWRGEFMPWIDSNLEFSRSNARRYMYIAKHWDRVHQCGNLHEALCLLRGSTGYKPRRPKEMAEQEPPVTQPNETTATASSLEVAIELGACDEQPVFLILEGHAFAISSIKADQKVGGVPGNAAVIYAKGIS